MLQLTTVSLVRIGSAVVAVATLVAAVGGWVGLDIIQASLSIAPEVEEMEEPSRGMIESIDGTLEEVRVGLQTLESITSQVAESTEDVAEVVDEVAALSTGRVPETLAALDEALPALIDTAAVIDSTMRTLSVLGVDYSPQVPLDEAFADVQEQLDGLPESISRQGESLAALVGELRDTGTETELLSGQIDSIERSLAETQLTLEDYDIAIGNLSELSVVSDRIDASIPVARVALVILAISGLLIGMIGWTLARRLEA